MMVVIVGYLQLSSLRIVRIDHQSIADMGYPYQGLLDSTILDIEFGFGGTPI